MSKADRNPCTLNLLFQFSGKEWSGKEMGRKMKNKHTYIMSDAESAMEKNKVGKAQGAQGRRMCF